MERTKVVIWSLRFEIPEVKQGTMGITIDNW